MLKKLMPAVLLTLAATSAQADSTTWTFTYQGLFDESVGVFDPRIKVSGSFTAEDLDRDGTIRMDELSALTVSNVSYRPCSFNDGYVCSLDSFTYALDGKLDFSVEEGEYDGFGTAFGTKIIAGEYVYRWWYGPSGRANHYYRWTPQTSFTISPPPVPEPSTYAMLGVGMLLLGVRRASKRRWQ
jgi:hypothetical protein